jgi:hypothetical protein
MAMKNVGRVIFAVLAGYITDAALVIATELALRVPSRHVAQPLRYYVIDLITQCLYTVIGGYITCAIAGPVHRAAMITLICLGLLVGSASLTASWHMEPHWYGIGLLAVYAPCVWIGCSLRLRSAR